MSLFICSYPFVLNTLMANCSCKELSENEKLEIFQSPSLLLLLLLHSVYMCFFSVRNTRKYIPGLYNSDTYHHHDDDEPFVPIGYNYNFFFIIICFFVVCNCFKYDY